MNGQAVEFPKQALLTRLALSDSGFVFDPVTGNSFTVNTSGLSILRLLQKTEDWTDIIATLQADFEVSYSVAERDVLEFATALRSAFK
ncbi:MAG: PqqD family protein [Gallionella sp.]|nr:PqqD family protein [Gallionella sp.]MDD4959876.1 PqqD family protein [Gallionella sp.]